MKLTTFIMFIALLQVTAATKAQVTINAKQGSLRNVLKSISKQSGYDFIYSVQDLKDLKATNIRLKNASITEALEVTLGNQPVVYEVSEKTVMVKKREEKVVIDRVAVLAIIEVSGYVFDENNQPLSGVTIRVKDGKGLTTTNQQGVFILKNVDEGAVLQISYMGYVSQEVNAANNLGVIKLKLSDNPLDEVQIQAYGKTSRRLSISNISTIKAEDIAKSPVNNPLLALQGRVTGVSIQQVNGIPGGGIVVRIQGRTSMSQGTEPLYVVDGVPYTNTLLGQVGSGILGNSGAKDPDVTSGNFLTGNPLAFINPNNIESIDVLKDADATSIYGSRAAAGAILITTKKGNSGKFRTEFNLQQGAGKVTRRLKMMNTEQYLAMRKQAYVNDKLTVPGLSTTPSSSNYDLTVYDQNHYTDWQEELIGGTASYSDFQASFSGGSSNIQTLFGGNYHRETTVFPGNFSDQKIGANVSLNFNSDNRRLNMQFNSQFMLDNNQLPSADLTGVAVTLAPNSPSIYNRDGSLNWGKIRNPVGASTDSISTWRNPIAPLLNRFMYKLYNLITSANGSYLVTKGLKLSMLAGYNNMKQNNISTVPVSSFAPERRATSLALASYGNGSLASIHLEPQLSFDTQFSSSNLKVLMGLTYNEFNSSYSGVVGQGYLNDQKLEDMGSASTVIKSPSTASLYRYNAIFGSINYNWQSKYLLNLSMRRDGSSRFGSENRFHNFGSIGVGWIFSNEKWIKEHFSFLSYGKSRVSFGTTGNDQIGNYSYLSLYSSGSIPYQTITLSPTGHANPYLQWEETRKLQAGIELGFFEDRLFLSGGYYRNRSSNQLASSPLNFVTGFGSVNLNQPHLFQNSGWEMELKTSNLKGEFSWNTNMNITASRNKMLKINPNSGILADNLGLPLFVARVTQFGGVDPATGLYYILDKSGKVTNNAIFPDDYVIIDLTQKFQGGVLNSFKFKGFQLDVLLQFAKQIGPSIFFGISSPPGVFTTAGGNQPAELNSTWTKNGDLSNVQRYTVDRFNATYGVGVNSDKQFSDASYIRLKNISFSWQIPTSWSKIAKMNSARIFVQGQNLLTITNYNGLDPENPSAGIGGLPPLKVLTCGIQLSL